MNPLILTLLNAALDLADKFGAGNALETAATTGIRSILDAIEKANSGALTVDEALAKVGAVTSSLAADYTAAKAAEDAKFPK